MGNISGTAKLSSLGPQVHYARCSQQAYFSHAAPALNSMRSILAIAVGGVVAAAGYWVGAVIALLTMHGIPLGSPGGPSTRGDVLAHLVIAMFATLAGARIAVRIEPQWPARNAFILGLLLGAAVMLGFSKRGSGWPPWFPVTMAAACLLAGVLAGRFFRGVSR
jgi:hypothetical protein